MKLTTIFSACVLTCGIAVAEAATPFDEAVAEILANNPSIATTRSRLLSGVEQTLGENTLEAPEVEFSRVWGADEVGNKWSLSVSQSFDWPGVYSARRKAAKAQQSASEYAIESAVMDMRLEVRNALIDIIHNTQLLAVQRRLVGQMQDFAETYRKGVELGDETRLDLNRAVIELVGAKEQLNTLQAQRSSLISALRTLNGGRPVDALVESLGENYPIFTAVVADSVSPEVIRRRDPAYAAAEASLQAAREARKVESRLSLPGFSIGYEHETEMDEHFNGFSLGLTLPVWGRRHQRKAAAFEEEAARIEAETALAVRAAQMEADLDRLVALRATLDEYEPVVNTTENIDLLGKAFDARQISFPTYLQDMNYFIEANKAYLDTLYEYNLTLSSLKRYE